MPAQCCKDFIARIPDDEPIFTIAARDRIAPLVVAGWINAAIVSGVPDDKVLRAREHLNAIMTWQAENPDKVKLPD